MICIYYLEDLYHLELGLGSLCNSARPTLAFKRMHLKYLGGCLGFVVSACKSYESIWHATVPILPTWLLNFILFLKGVDSQEKCVYLNGCSLGLQPKGTQKLVDDELEKWRKR